MVRKTSRRELGKPRLGVQANQFQVHTVTELALDAYTSVEYVRRTRQHAVFVCLVPLLVLINLQQVGIN